MSRPAFDLQAFNARLDALPAEAVKAVRETLKTGAEDAAALIRRNAPRDHGDLASTVAVAPGRSSMSFDVSVGGAGAPYAPQVEFGHMDKGVHVAAHPYFFPAVRVSKKKLRAKLIRVFNKTVRAILSGGSAS